MLAEENTSPNLYAHLRDLEERLLRPEVRSSPEALRTLLAEGFREFGSSGRVFTRAEMIAELAREAEAPGVERGMSGFGLEMLAPDVALVTYRAHRTVAGGGVESLRSSVWRFCDGRWRMVFHQGTAVAGR